MNQLSDEQVIALLRRFLLVHSRTFVQISDRLITGMGD